MAKNPDQRYRTTVELARAARDAITALMAQRPSGPTHHPPTRGGGPTLFGTPHTMAAPVTPSAFPAGVPPGPRPGPPPGPPKPVSPVPGPPRGQWPRRNVLIAAALLLAAALTITIFVATKPQTQQSSPSPTTVSASPTTVSASPTAIGPSPTAIGPSPITSSTAPSQSSTSVTPASATGELTGRWSGHVTGDQSLDLVADIVDGPPLTARVTYPGQNCTCSWTQHGPPGGNGTRWVTENVISGNCTQSEVTLFPQQDGTLLFTSTYYSASQRRSFKIQGILRR